MTQTSAQTTPFAKRALRYVFAPDFGRALNQGRSPHVRGTLAKSLLQALATLGLIEVHHPFMRADSRVGVAEVLAYAWARLDWRRPFTPQVMLVLAFSALMAMGVLILIAFVASLFLGGGQAYAQSLFVAPNPGTDLALNYITRAFGISITGVPAGITDSLVTGFKTMMGMYSTAMLVIGGFMLLYIILSAVAGTAHEGRVGGSGFNQVWAPIRLVIAIGLLVPIAGGYNSGQYVVMKIAEWGSNVASNLWVPFATNLASRNNVLAIPNLPSVSSVVSSAVIQEVCMAFFNKARAIDAIGGPISPDMYVQKFDQTITAAGGISKTYKTVYTDNQAPERCGSVTITERKAIGQSTSIVAALSAAHIAAYNTMRANVKATVVAPLMADPNALPVDKDMDSTNLNRVFAPYTPALIAATRSYQTNLAAAISSVYVAQGTTASDSMTTAVKNAGWAGAATWFNTISRLNSEFSEAVGSIPNVSPPKLAGQKTDITVEKTMKAVVMTSSWLGSLGSITTTGAINTTGGGSGGIAAGSTVLGIADVDTSGVQQALNVIFDFVFLNDVVGGPFSRGIGPDFGIAQANPLAELSAIGSWLTTKSFVLIGIAAAANSMDSFMKNTTIGKLISTNPIAGVVGGLAGGIASISWLLILFALAGLGAGITLTYVLPLMPFIRFLFNVVGWLLHILEAIIAMPLVALAHLNTRGDGVAGDVAMNGYYLVLSIFLRPALMIVGMVVGLAMFIISIGILNDMYKAAVTGWVGDLTSGTVGPFGMIIYTLIYVVIAFALCNTCFKLIEDIPNGAMKWIGRSGLSEQHGDEEVQRAVGGVGDVLVAPIGRRFGARGGSWIEKAR